MIESQELQIEQIVQSIFSTMMNVESFRGAEHVERDERTLTAAIQIAGAWVGAVTLDLPRETARGAAAAMLAMSPDDVTDEDEYDVASELANMVGGNLKSLLPGPSYLSLPTIISGREFVFHVRDAMAIDDVSFVSEIGPLRVRLYADVTG